MTTTATTTTMPNPTLEALRVELRERLRDLPGTPAFAEALAERERLLGLNATPATEIPDASRAHEAGKGQASPLDATLDAWGNIILDTSGSMGQYRIRSARDHRILRVCGEAATTKHLLWWDYDAGERRLVCRVCWPRRPASSPEAGQEPGQDD